MMNNSMTVYIPEIELLKRYDDFSSFSTQDLEKLKRNSGILNLKKGKSLFRSTDKKTLLYLVSGEVEIKSKDKSYFVNTFSEKDDVRKALNQRDDILSIMTTRHSSILCVDKSEFYSLLSLQNMGEYLVEDLSDTACDATGFDWSEALLASKLFFKIPATHIQKLFGAFKSKRIARGVRVVSEGEKGDEFYVIKKGHALVSRRDAQGRNVDIANLKPGHYFGEEALVGETIRNASITMSTDGELMCLSKDDFKALLQEPVLKSVSPVHIDKWRNERKDVVLIDVRLPIEFRNEQINGGVNIPLQELRKRIPELDHNAYYVMMCDSGQRSRLGAYLLNEAGLNAYVLAS